MVEVFSAVRSDLERDLLDEHGLTEGDYGVLVELSEADDHRMRMCDLAGHLHLSPSGLTRRLDGLVAAGRVARVPAPEDRRVSLAELTPAGMRRLEEAAPSHVAGVRRHLLDHLSPSQVRQLASALEVVKRRRAEGERCPTVDR